jgi:hypothetical protein
MSGRTEPKAQARRRYSSARIGEDSLPLTPCPLRSAEAEPRFWWEEKILTPVASRGGLAAAFWWLFSLKKFFENFSVVLRAFFALLLCYKNEIGYVFQPL